MALAVGFWRYLGCWLPTLLERVAFGQHRGSHLGLRAMHAEMASRCRRHRAMHACQRRSSGNRVCLSQRCQVNHQSRHRHRGRHLPPAHWWSRWPRQLAPASRIYSRTSILAWQTSSCSRQHGSTFCSTCTRTTHRRRFPKRSARGSCQRSHASRA